jgi:hypothetical protein
MKLEFGFQVFSSCQDRKTNSFVPFLGEVMAQQFCFEIYCHLKKPQFLLSMAGANWPFSFIIVDYCETWLMLHRLNLFRLVWFCHSYYTQLRILKLCNDKIHFITMILYLKYKKISTNSFNN